MQSAVDGYNVCIFAYGQVCMVLISSIHSLKFKVQSDINVNMECKSYIEIQELEDVMCTPLRTAY